MKKKNLRGVNFPGLPDDTYMMPEYNSVQDDATDLSALVEPGRYRYSSTTENLPNGLRSGFVDVVAQDTSFVWQIFHDTSAGIAYRTLTIRGNGYAPLVDRLYRNPMYASTAWNITWAELEEHLSLMLNTFSSKLVGGFTGRVSFTDMVTPLGLSGVTASVTVHCESEGYGYALLRFYNEQIGTLTARKECYNGEWSDLMWDNPPMEIDVEYCTTELWQGMPVYTKLIDFGAMSGVTMKAVAHNLGATQIVRYFAQVSDGTTLPYDDGSVTVTASCNHTSLIIRSNIDQSATHTAKFQVWYTKD